MHMLILRFHVYQPDGAIIQYKYPNRVYFDCNTQLCPIIHGKYSFTQESFYLQGVLNDINVQDISFLDCKHKHMMKSGAPPDKILYHLLPIESYGFTSRIDFEGLSLFGSRSYLNFFRGGMGLFNMVGLSNTELESDFMFDNAYLCRLL